MSKKMTAVEWLVEELEQFYGEDFGCPMELYKQAKEMEKQQIIDTADYFTSEWELYDGEQYYNETYEQE